MQIVHRIQNLRQQLIRRIKMTQISPRIPLTDKARASRIERPRVLRIASLLDRNPPLRRKQQPMPSRPRGQNAVHHIDAHARIKRNLLWSPPPHQVPRLVFRKVLERRFDNLPSKLPRLTNAKSANRISRKPNLHRPQSRLPPQFAIHPSLHNPEQSLRLPSHVLLRFVILSEAKDMLLLRADS